MLTRVAFENFRGFRRFDAPVGAVTALLGPNSSGKTTALHAVRIACELVREAVRSDQPANVKVDDGVPWILVTRDTLLTDPRRLLPLADWRALFVDQEVDPGATLTLQLYFEASDPIQEVWVQVTCARNEQLKLEVWVRSDEAVGLVKGLASKSKLVNQRLSQFVEDHAPLAVLVPPFYGTVPDEELRSRAVLDRLLGSGDQSHVVRNLIADLDPTQFDQLNGFLRDAFPRPDGKGARLTYRTTGDLLQTESPLVVTFRDSNGDIELSAAGAGFVNLVALYTALSRWRHASGQRRVLFLLDEPEAHLHPRLQAESAERLGRLAREFGAQLLLATHSIDILNRLSTSGALLLRCDRSADPSVVPLDSDSALFEDLSGWADLTPYTAINFLAARKVLFCEGADESVVLPKLAAVRYRNDPARASSFRRWALVQLHGASNRPLSELLGRLVRNDVVRARAQVTAFEVFVVLDRDHERTPGVQRSDSQGVLETSFVWPVHSLESVFLDPTSLAEWIRALTGEASPSDLPDRIAAALAAANADASLNDAAVEQLAAKFLSAELKDQEGRLLSGEQKAVHAIRRASELVRAAPGTWQRGKDRARTVLGLLRPAIALPARNQFPTDLIRLIERTDVSRISNVLLATPGPVADLLERLTTPER